MSGMVCPHCLAVVAGHEHVGPVGVAPESGDVMVCGGCREVAVFASRPGGGLVLRTPSAAELAEAYGEPGTRVAREALLACRGNSGAAVARARCDPRVAR